MTEEDDGLVIRYLPVNQAWVVMFGDSILKGPCPKADAEAYVRDLRASVAAHPAGKGEDS